MKKFFLWIVLVCLMKNTYCWGFFGHRLISQYAVFLLPPEMIVLYKNHLSYIYNHAVDADKRRYAVEDEGPKHYIDIDNYGKYPYPELPRKYEEAVDKFGETTVLKNGIVPWTVQTMLKRLTGAFKNKDLQLILRYSSDLGHYVADAHVPLHASNNHNGQLTDQSGIHAFWESRVPELMANRHFDFFIGRAEYIRESEGFIWERILESSLAADSVLKFEKLLSEKYGDNKYAYEPRNGVVTRQYSTAYTIEFEKMLGGMVERRMRQSIYAVASYWYTAWVEAGQPDLKETSKQLLSGRETEELKELDEAWKAGKVKGRAHED